VPKSTTLDDIEGSLCSLFRSNTCAMVLLLIYIVSHSICFYTVSDCSINLVLARASYSPVL